MKVLITGGHGLLGAAIVHALLDAEHAVTIFDRSCPLSTVAQTIIGNHQEFSAVYAACLGQDAIIHTSGIHSFGICPNEDIFASNVLGTFNVHEAAAKHQIKRVISTSSEAAYGFFFGDGSSTPDYLPLDEDHPLTPSDAYGLSKQVGEDIAESYYRRHGMTTIVLRPSWITTPHDYEHHQGLLSGHAFHGDRFSPHAYIDVRDAAEAYRLALDPAMTGHHRLNICADDSTLLPTDQPSGISNARAKAVLGWQPKYSWRDGK